MSSRILVLLLVPLIASACGQSAATEPGTAGDLRVRRADFQKHHLLTGELEAAIGDVVVVPRIPQWQTTVKWIAEDGETVAPGQKVVELDNSAFTSNLEERRLAAAQAEQNLAKDQARLSAELAERQFEVEKRRLDLEKARVEASVPATVVSLREYQDRQLALSRAEQEYRKAEANLAAKQTAIKTDLENLKLELQKTLGEIEIAERAIQSLDLRAPRSGIMVVSDHPWEGRKLQVGDTAWVGMTLVTLPELSTLQVVATLPDVDDGEIAVGMPATVTMDAYPDQTFAGRIKRITPVAQEAASQSLRRGFRVVVELERVDTERMRPGFSVKASVLTVDGKGVLVAPRAALDFSDPASVRATRRGGDVVPVRVGSCNAHECVVLSGLKEGAALEVVR